MSDGVLLERARWVAICLLAALLVAVFASTTASAAEATTVSIAAPSQPLEAGQQFSIGVEVAPDTAIAGMQFDLSFDPSLVAVEGIVEGDLLGHEGATTFFSPGSIDNEAGTITGAFGAITSPGQTVSRQGTFATVVLTAKQGCESCPFSLSNVIVGDKEGNAVPVRYDNDGAASAVEGAAFDLWLLGIIIGMALVVIAATITGVMLRRRQMVRAADGERHERRSPHSG